MIKILLFAVLALATTISYAQTPTPTPHPNALDVGMYNILDLSSPEMELTGGDWSARNFYGQTGLGTDDADDQLTFHVTESADYLILYRATVTAGSSAGTWEICVDETCTDVNDRSGGGIEPVAIQLYESNSEVVITKINGNQSIWFTLIIVQDEITAGIGTPTAGLSMSPL